MVEFMWLAFNFAHMLAVTVVLKNQKPRIVFLKKATMLILSYPNKTDIFFKKT